MPYIHQSHREKIDAASESLKKVFHELKLRDFSPGELNYTITTLIIHALELDTNPRYWRFNTAIGVLECVKQELYRRMAAPYEDKKIKETGDLKEFTG